MSITPFPLALVVPLRVRSDLLWVLGLPELLPPRGRSPALRRPPVRALCLAPLHPTEAGLTLDRPGFAVTGTHFDRHDVNPRRKRFAGPGALQAQIPTIQNPVR